LHYNNNIFCLNWISTKTKELHVSVIISNAEEDDTVDIHLAHLAVYRNLVYSDTEERCSQKLLDILRATDPTVSQCREGTIQRDKDGILTVLRVSCTIQAVPGEALLPKMVQSASYTPMEGEFCNYFENCSQLDGDPTLILGQYEYD